MKKLLDLFCREGGAAAGYVAAGWEVHGVDIEDHRHRYLQSGATSFTQADASTFDLSGYDAVHASPPCEDHSTTMGFGLSDRGTGWLLPHTIERVRGLTVPWVVENVESRKVKEHMGEEGRFRLCGSAFNLGACDSRGNYRILRRHRLFLSNVDIESSPCECRGKLVGGVYGHGEQGVNGGRGYGFAADRAREALETPWMSRDGAAECIPPAYTLYIGQHLTSILETTRLHRVQMNPQRGRGNMAVRRSTRTAPGGRTAAAAPAPRKNAPARRQAPAAPAKPSRDVTQYADKEPTPYHKAFAIWILKEVGLSLDGKSPKAAFLAGVSIATAARAAFQESDFLEEWRERTGEVKRGPKPATEKAAPASRRRKPEPEPEPEEEEEEWEEDDTEEADDEFDSEDDSDEDDDSEDESDDDEDWEDEEEPAPAPKRPARKAAPTRARAGAKAPVKATKPTSGRPAKAKAAPADEDDFVF